MTTTLVIAFVVVAALFALGLMLLRGSRREPVAASLQRAPEPIVAAAPISSETPRFTADEPVTEEEAPPSAPEPEAVSVPSSGIRWSKRFDPASGALDDESRLKLIRDLGFLRGAWCIPLLVQAYEEETGVEHRRAVLTALAAYRHPDARSTFEAALEGSDEQGRSIAAAALIELDEQ